MTSIWRRVVSWWISRSCQGCGVSLVIRWSWHIRTSRHQAIHGPTRGVIHRVGCVGVSTEGIESITGWWVRPTAYGYGFWIPVTAHGADRDPEGIRIAGWTLGDLQRTFGPKVVTVQ